MVAVFSAQHSHIGVLSPTLKKSMPKERDVQMLLLFFCVCFFRCRFFVVNFCFSFLLVVFSWLDPPTASVAEKVSNDVSSFDVSDFKVD